jgi:hypothetical protein
MESKACLAGQHLHCGGQLEAITGNCYLCQCECHGVKEDIMPPVHKATINHVRQILMNELGLTRDSIRDMVREITTETVTRFFNSGDFEKFLRDQINKQFRTYHYDSDELQKLVTKLIAEAIQKDVKNRLSIGVDCSFQIKE